MSISRTGTRTLILIAAVLAVLAAMLVNAAPARADEGEITGLTGPSGFNGTYQIPDLGEGWCIDPALTEPMGNGGTTYGDPMPWEAPNPDQKAKLIFAIKAAELASRGSEELDALEPFLGTRDVKTIYAASSAVIHEVGFKADPAPGTKWDSDQALGGESAAAKPVFEKMMGAASIMESPTAHILFGDPEAIELKVREPADEGFQRMIALQDVELELPEEVPAPEPRIASRAELSSEYMEEGATVTDTITYEFLEPGAQYTLQAQMMCKEGGSPASDVVEHTFTADDATGKTEVRNIPIEEPDCHEQVVFQTLVDAEGNVVAEHHDIDDRNQTVGGTPPTTETRVESTTETKVESTTVTEAPEERPAKITLNKRDSETGERLVGAEFEIVDESGQVLHTWTTKDDFLTMIVDPGTYTVRETSTPAGYEGDYEETVTVKEGEEKVLDALNRKKPEPEVVETTVTEKEVVEQERATIIFVPSGPVGGNAPDVYAK